MGSPLSILQICSARQATYGAVQSLMTLARAQRSAGHNVEFLTFAGKRFGGQVREEGFHVTEIPVRTKIDPVAVAKMRRLIRARGYDIVHTHLSTSSVNGGLAARSAGVPSVATVHGMSGKLSFAAARHLIAVSQEVKRHLVTQGVRDEKISVVYNGLPMEVGENDRGGFRLGLGIPIESLVFGTIARVTPSKGIDDAIRAVRTVRDAGVDAYYLVVGDGDGLVECRRLAQALKIEAFVRFLGYRIDVDACLAAMDLFLFPSHKEAMGIALVEAMRMGVPIIATDVGGIPEVVTAECGVLIKDRRPDQMAEAALRLVRDSSLRIEMSRRCQLRAREVFSADAMEESTTAVYQTMLGRPNVAGGATWSETPVPKEQT